MIKSHKNQSIKQQETWHIKNFTACRFRYMSFDSSFESKQQKKQQLRCTQNKMFYKSVCVREYHRLWLLIRSNVKTKNQYLVYIFKTQYYNLVYFSSSFFILSFVLCIWYCWIASFCVCLSGIKWISQFNDFNHKKIVIKQPIQVQILGLNSLQLGFHWIFSSFFLHLS